MITAPFKIKAKQNQQNKNKTPTNNNNNNKNVKNQKKSNQISPKNKTPLNNKNSAKQVVSGRNFINRGHNMGQSSNYNPKPRQNINQNFNNRVNKGRLTHFRRNKFSDFNNASTANRSESVQSHGHVNINRQSPPNNINNLNSNFLGQGQIHTYRR